MKKLLSVIFLSSISLSIWADSDSGQLVDPTRPPDHLLTDSAAVSNSPLTLTAIFAYPDHSIAIINEQSVAVGDKIGDFSVTSITKNTVELLGSDNKPLVLELVPDIKARNK